jgi:hypothetical protein
MKRIHFLIRFMGIFFLMISATAVRAQEQGPESEAGAQAAEATDVTWQRLYLMRTTETPTPWWQTSTLVDNSGGVHTAYFTNHFIHYAYCPANCGDPASWSQTQITTAGPYDSLDYPTLALDSNDRPRMMWFKDSFYYYAECDANCIQAASWTAVQVPVANQIDYIYPQTSRYFALDSQGRPRFVCYGSDYDDYGVYMGFNYTTCDANCTNAVNWRSDLIDIQEYFYDPQIVLTANDQPRVMGKLDNETLGYLGCNADCSQSASWSLVSLYPVGDYGNLAFHLDSQDRPRVAFYNGNSSEPNLYYAWSNSTDPASTAWSSYGMDLPPFDWRTVDLALDSQNRPRLAYASDQGDLEYAECTANCESTASSWQLQPVETAADLDASDPIPLDTACTVTAWLVEGYPSLALDAADRPSVSYYARHSQFCLGVDNKYHIIHDAWALRLATAGAAGGNNGQIYLPLILLRSGNNS